VVGPAAHQVLGHTVTKKIYEAWDNMIGQVAKLASCCLTSQVPLTTSLTHVCSTTYGKGEWTGRQLSGLQASFGTDIEASPLMAFGRKNIRLTREYHRGRHCRL
jgi:hypothetical protein